MQTEQKFRIAVSGMSTGGGSERPTTDLIHLDHNDDEWMNHSLLYIILQHVHYISMAKKQ